MNAISIDINLLFDIICRDTDIIFKDRLVKINEYGRFS